MNNGCTLSSAFFSKRRGNIKEHDRERKPPYEVHAKP